MFEFKKLFYIFLVFFLNYKVIFCAENTFDLNEHLKLSSLAKEHFESFYVDINSLKLEHRNQSFSLKIYSEDEEIILNIKGSKFKRNCGNFALEKYWISCDRNLKSGLISIELYEKKN